MHNCFRVTMSWNLYLFLPSMFWPWPRTAQAIVCTALLGFIRMTAAPHKHGFPVDRLPPIHGLHWSCEAAFVPQRHLPPISRPIAYPLTSLMATPRTRMHAGRLSHGAPPVDLVARWPGQSGCPDGDSWRWRPAGMAMGGTEDGLVVAWPRNFVGSHVPDLVLAAAMSPTLLLLTPSTTPSCCCLPNLPLPVSSHSSFMYPFQIPFLISRWMRNQYKSLMNPTCHSATLF
jgi:hypothetical protein